MPRIHVFTLQFGSLPYFPLARAINQRYCLRHGHPFTVGTPQSLPDRHPIWSKVKLALDLLPTCDYLLFLDADAVFHNHERPIQSLIEHLEAPLPARQSKTCPEPVERVENRERLLSPPNRKSAIENRKSPFLLVGTDRKSANAAWEGEEPAGPDGSGEERRRAFSKGVE